MMLEQIARVCHEANRALCAAQGDDSQLAWLDAEPWQRDSARKGVEFRRDNPHSSPEAQHAAWCADKVRDGWSCGPVKDAVAKKHPCLVPYDWLPAAQQAKDHLFAAVCAALLPFASE